MITEIDWIDPAPDYTNPSSTFAQRQKNQGQRQKPGFSHNCAFMNWLDSGYKPYQKEKAEKRPRFPYICSGLLRCWPSVFRHELNGSNPLVCLKAIRVLLYDCVILWGKWAIRSSLQVPLRDVQPTWGGKTMDHRHRIKIEKSCIHGWLWVKTMMRTPSWHWSRVTAQASAEEFMYGDRSHRYFRIYGYESHIIYF